MSTTSSSEDETSYGDSYSESDDSTSSVARGSAAKGSTDPPKLVFDCDNCKKRITGERYSCTTCKQTGYDLCASCYSKLKRGQIKHDHRSFKKYRPGELSAEHRALQKQLEGLQRYIKERDPHMLYVEAYINKHRVDALVDTGAQSTVMSFELAKKVGLTSLLDRRFSGTAIGVGTARIVGRVHSANVQLGDYDYDMPITIIALNSIGFMIGLDFIKRHKAAIDMGENALLIENEVIPFLSEKEVQIPKVDEPAVPPTTVARDPGNEKVECKVQ